MLLIPTLDQAHHSPRAAWDTQLPPSSLHSTHIRHIGTELCWSLSVHCCSCCRTGCSILREPGVGHANVLYNHIFTMSSSRVPPVVTDWGGSFQVVPKFGVRLEMKVLAQLCCGFAPSIVYLTWFRLTKHSFQ